MESAYEEDDRSNTFDPPAYESLVDVEVSPIQEDTSICAKYYLICCICGLLVLFLLGMVSKILTMV